MVCSHQSVFVCNTAIKSTPFNLDYKIAADFDQIKELYKQNYTFHYLPIAIAKTTIGGVSYSNVNTIKEQVRILRAHKQNRVAVLILAKLLPVYFVHNVFGKGMISMLRNLKWKYFKSN